MNKLMYKDRKWTLIVDGVEVPDTKIVTDGLRMTYDELPSVEVIVDEVEIDGVVTKEVKEG